MSWIKVILLNILITFSFLGMLLLTPPLTYFLYSVITKIENKSTSIDRRAYLDLYNDIPWAEKHFSEYSKLSTTYYDFITWRKNDFKGETINITNGVRATTGSQRHSNDFPDYYFFGGSTTWGFGVNDDNTFPSLFARRINTQVYNFGEAAYIARQSLAFLNNYLIENSITDLSRRHVVFYDGVNDVSIRCRSEIDGLGTEREHQIQTKLATGRYSFARLFEQVTEFLQAVSRKLGMKSNMQVAETTYSCSSNPDRAEEVARTLVETWQVASDLVTQRGGTFTAILQPVAYVGSPNITYLDLNSIYGPFLSMQFKVVYPLIKKFAEVRNLNFVDLSEVYNNCSNCYIDFNHVGPRGHEILVDSLVQKLSQ